MESEASKQYIRSLLNKTLYVHVTDGRQFHGMLKCTDNQRNLILSQAFEYRKPSESTVAAAAEAASQGQDAGGTFRVDMESRFMGLVSVPGEHITKIELE